MAARVRVYRRGKSGEAQPCELLPWEFGGRYDTLAACYIGPADPANVREIKVHGGQVPLVDAIGGGKRWILSIGPQGGGKTEGNVSVAALLSLYRCNSIGGMVVPVADARAILWKKFIARVGPFGWIAEERTGAGEILLKNGTLLQFRATAKQSAAAKSPIAGLDWHWCVPDEEAYMDDDAVREIEARGRIAADYQIFSSATNEPIHAFQMRLLRRKSEPTSLVVRYSGPDNCFTPLEHWEALKSSFSDEDYARYVECKDVPREGRVYPAFDYEQNTAPLPPIARDCTARDVYDKYRARGVEYVVGWDPGSTMSASVIMKCYDAGGTDRHWFILDEVSTRDATTEFHGRDLSAWFQKQGIPLAKVIVIGDPHENKETDRSDYMQMQRFGFAAVKRSNGGETIERKHRIAMVNALLKDATGRRRLYLAAGPTGIPKATKTAESLGHLMYTYRGDIDFKGKTAYNLAHWTDAPGYGLFPFERFCGGPPLSLVKYK